MISYINRFFSFVDPISSIYKHIDFDNAVIGGSYALHQYTLQYATEQFMWSPDDVDVHTKAEDINDFKEIVEKFCRDTNATLNKFNDFSKGHPDDRDFGTGLTKRDEKFHESVKASATMTVPNIDLKVQYIYIQGQNSNEPVEAQLERITDLPSCVSYKVSRLTGEKSFIIPAKGIEALRTRLISKADICPSRMEKYSKRGYTFY